MRQPFEERLERQIRFLLEIDRLKSVLRRTSLADDSRRENTAEHSWHIAVAAIVLAEHARPGTDLGRVIRMLLLHDIVEIDAGDTFCYDAAAREDEAERERTAADRIFALLPQHQAQELRSLWEEFAAGETPDAQFASAADRLQPLLLDLHAGGGSWRSQAVTPDDVIERMQPVRSGLPDLWGYVEWAVEEALARGYLR